MYTSITSSVIVITLAIISGVHSLSWEKAEAGKLPPKAAKLYPNTRKPHYFCRVVLESGSLSYGQLTDTSPSCTYPAGRKALTSTKFDILVRGEETLDWEYGRTPSSKAVRCDLEEGEGGDCFLGQGVYSDGICEEALGYIRPSLRNIYMTAYGRVESCPLYLFLTQF
eukprot:GFUD01037275.1.p1 GENE.GFUD01037275.1~~GFUD01037275.1.p1  ORF type:complete len:168 (+),score=40.68 GFUD01037275.1:38-541(+)